MNRTHRPACTRVLYRSMLLFFLVVALLLSGGQATAEEPPPPQPAVIGGTPAAVGEFPFTVSIVYADSNLFVCGGSLLSDQWVVTAAHCAINPWTGQPEPAGALAVILGSLAPTSVQDGQYLYVTEVLVHPGYNSAFSYDHDIALLRLAGVAAIDTPQIATVPPLLSSREEPFAAPGTLATVAGWGLTEAGQSNLANQLHKASVPIVPRDTCDPDPTSPTDIITENMLCAGGIAGVDTCVGDSGGPLLVSDNEGNWLLAGITSFGPWPCAQADKHGVYTRVAAHVPWIAQYVQLDSYEPEPERHNLYLPLVVRVPADETAGVLLPASLEYVNDFAFLVNHHISLAGQHHLVAFT